MSLSRVIRRPAAWLALALPTYLLCLPAGVAHAEPANEGSFEILYSTTDDNGKALQMSARHLSGYLNQARCECGQTVRAAVRLTPGQNVDSVNVSTFVGSQCASAQLGVGTQATPCAELFTGLTNAYNTYTNFDFHPLWLKSGVMDGSTQSIAGAVAAEDCSSGEGSSGVWICAESNGTADCQPDEFVVQGLAHINPLGAMETPNGIFFDYRPPNKGTTGNVRVDGGDGSVVVEWDNDGAGEITGFRVLCAEMDGSPVSGKGFKLPSVTSDNATNSVYYTPENLCPDGPFSEIEIDPNAPSPNDQPFEPGDTDGGDTDGRGTDGGATDGGTAGGADGLGDTDAGSLEQDADPQQGAPGCCEQHGTPGCSDLACEELICGVEPGHPCCDSAWSEACASAATAQCDVCTVSTTTDGVATTSGGAGSSTGTGTGTATGTATGTTDATGGVDFQGSDIRSLDWAYVCSGHRPQNTTKTKITGLTNGVPYQILLVGYDDAGNWVEVSDVLVATPRETTDLWEQCEEQGNVCGEGGFCNCSASPSRPGSAGLWLLGLGLLGLRRRSRGRARK